MFLTKTLKVRPFFRVGKAVFYIVHNNDSIALIDFPYRSQDRYAKLGSKKQEPPPRQVTVLP